MKVFDPNTVFSCYHQTDEKIAVSCDINPRLSEAMKANEDIVTELQETMDHKIAKAICELMDRNEEYVFNYIFSDVPERNDMLTVYLSGCRELSDGTRRAVMAVIEGIMENMSLLFGFTAF